jgi:hypothetical protein
MHSAREGAEIKAKTDDETALFGTMNSMPTACQARVSVLNGNSRPRGSMQSVPLSRESLTESRDGQQPMLPSCDMRKQNQDSTGRMLALKLTRHDTGTRMCAVSHDSNDEFSNPHHSWALRPIRGIGNRIPSSTVE